jgi:uncharacterized protein (DUF1697 family)
MAGDAREWYVVLLRGINVGGHRKVPMAQLRDVVGELGYGDVRTHLQSGNVVFTAPVKPSESHAAVVGEAIARRFGFTVDCLGLSRDELRAAAGRCPFDVDADGFDPAKLLVLFLDGPAGEHPLASADPARYAPDEVRLGEREIFAYFPGGMGRSKLGELASAAWRGGTATGRNWRTVTKLLELTAGP